MTQPVADTFAPVSDAPAPDRDPATEVAVASPPPALRVVYTHPRRRESTAATTTQPALPLQWDLPSGQPTQPRPQRHLRVVEDPPAARGSRPPAHPGPWAARLAPAILEVIAGERPVTQLTRWVSRDILRILARRHAAARRHPAGRDRTPPVRQTRSVRVQSCAPGMVEVSVVVRVGDRCRAMAFRLELVESTQGTRWLMTACEIG